MTFAKTIKIISFITLICVVYVHMQIKIFGLAYQGKTKENNIRTINEENGRLTYAILTLKSASHIGDRMLNEKSNMQFRNPQDIVTLTTPSDHLGNEDIIQQAELKREEKPIFNFLSFVKSR